MPTPAIHRVLEIRRQNPRRLIAQMPDGKVEFRKRVPWIDSSHLAQLIGPKPRRRITEDTARRIEAALKIQAGSLDVGAPLVAENPTYYAAQSPVAAVDLNAVVVKALALARAGQDHDEPSARSLAVLIAQTAHLHDPELVLDLLELTQDLERANLSPQQSHAIGSKLAQILKKLAKPAGE